MRLDLVRCALWFPGTGEADSLLPAAFPLLHSLLFFLSAESPALQLDMTLNARITLSPFWGPPPLPSVPVPVHQLYCEAPLPSLLAALLPQSNSLLSPFSITSLVAGHGGYGLTGLGPFNLIAQVRTAGRPAEPLVTQGTDLTEAPLRESGLGGGTAPCSPASDSSYGIDLCTCLSWRWGAPMWVMGHGPWVFILHSYQWPSLGLGQILGHHHTGHAQE